MKKLGLIVAPLIAVSLIVSCNNKKDEHNYLCFTCTSDSGDLSYFFSKKDETSYQVDLECSTDKVTWTKVKNAGTIEKPQLIYHFKKDESLYLRGKNQTGWSILTYDCGTCFSTGSDENTKFSLSGNIMSLLYKDDFDDQQRIPSVACFSYLFARCNIVDASELLLPATFLTDRCYEGMFYECTNLINAPTLLPATILKEYCYHQMFAECTNLIVPPTLDAQILEIDCCHRMFFKCENLVEPPVFSDQIVFAPAGCYSFAFAQCTHLISTPVLSATGLGVGCYESMFEDCSALNKATELKASKLEENCYCSMFSGCESLHVTENDTGKKIFTCPEEIPNHSVTDMFDEINMDPEPKHSYYYQ